MSDFIVIDEINGQVTNSESNIVSNLSSSESNIKQVINSSGNNIINNFKETYEIYEADPSFVLSKESILSSKFETNSTTFVDACEYAADEKAFYIFNLSYYQSAYWYETRFLINGKIQDQDTQPNYIGYSLNKGDKFKIQIRSTNSRTYSVLQGVYLQKILNGDATTFTNTRSNVNFTPQKDGTILLSAFNPNNSNTNYHYVSVNNQYTIPLRQDLNHRVYQTSFRVYKGVPVTFNASFFNPFICAYATNTSKSMKNIKSIQRGIFNRPTTDPTNITIGTINPEKTICLFDSDNSAVRLRSLEKNKLIVDATDSGNFTYQLVEFW